ncbi:MAG: P-type conjugative transfer protein TrbL [Pseudomonadota bacterium]
MFFSSGMSFKPETKTAKREPIDFQWKLLFWVLGISLLYIILVSLAQAQGHDVNGEPKAGGLKITFFNGLIDSQEASSPGMMTKILDSVRNTFFILAVIELAWAAHMWAVEKDDLGPIAAEIVKKIFFIGFGLALLQFAPEWIPSIIQTFREVGEKGSGVGKLTVDGILSSGFNNVARIWEGSPIFQRDIDPKGNLLVNICFGIVNAIGWLIKILAKIIGAVIPGVGDFIETIIDLPCIALNILFHLPELVLAFIATIIIIIAYAIAAFQLFCINMEMFILIPCGAIFLGLGASSWTAQFVNKYLAYCVLVGFRFIVIAVVLGLSEGAYDQTGKMEFEFGPIMEAMVIAIIQCILALRAPDIANAFISGQGSGLTLNHVVEQAQAIGNMKKQLAKMAAKQFGGPKGKALAAGMEMADAGKKAMKNLASDATGGKGGGKGSGGVGGALKTLGDGAAKAASPGPGVGKK